MSQFNDVPLLSWLAWPSWPTFNVADSLIVVGISILIITMYTEERRLAKSDSKNQEA
ncbi:MAG: signal peptidase II [Leptonema sp. (in: Bacteria)]|nr:signal peptidase II [Leptonema sp. (in: bacteria)]